MSMTNKKARDPEDIYRSRVRDETEGLPMFAAASPAPSPARSRSPEVERLIERLVPIAKELSEKVAEIAVDNLRIAAVQRGVLTGGEQGRSLSFLPMVFKRAGLEPTGRFRRSSIPKSHGNLVELWRRRVA